MPNPVIIDAIRTPVGALGGALAAVRPDDLAALVIKAIIERNQTRPGAGGGSLPGLRQPGRGGQPQRGAHGAAAGGTARQRGGRDGQPAVRLRAECGQPGGPRHPRRGRGGLYRGRRGIDEPGALFPAQGRGGLPVRQPDRLSTPPWAGAIPIPGCRNCTAPKRWARRPKISPRNARTLRARCRMHSPCARTSAPLPRSTRANSPRRLCRWSFPRKKAIRKWWIPTSARAGIPRWNRWRSSSRPSGLAGRSPPGTPPDLNDGAAALLVMSEEKAHVAWAETAGAHSFIRGCRRAAAHDGTGTRPGGPKSARTRRVENRQISAWSN